MSTIKNVIVKMVLNAGQMLGGLKEAQDGLAKFKTGVEGQLSGIGAMALKIGAGVAAAFSVNTAIEKFTDAQRAASRLGSVVAATGDRTGQTVESMQAMAAQLKQVTVFGGTAITEAQTRLSTFPDIAQEVFGHALEASADLSTVLGEDLSTAAMHLGKALESPEHGIQMLRRAGVLFSEDEQKVIKSLDDMGDKVTTQQLILDKMATTMGGAARADAATFAGQLDQTKNTMGELAKVVGSAIVPLMVAFGGTVKTVTKFFIEHSDSIRQVITWLAAAALAIAAYRAVMMTVTVALKAVAIGQALVQAMSGPAGWAALAAGAAVFAGSLMFINSQFKEIQASSAVAQAAARRTAAGMRMSQDAKDFAAKRAAFHEAEKAVAEAERELELKKMTEDQQVIAKLHEKGATDVQLQRVRGLLDELRIREEINKENEKFDEFIKSNAGSPLDKFQQQMIDLRQIGMRAITDEEKLAANAAEMKAALELASAVGEDKVNFAGAALKGSREANSAIIRHEAGSGQVDIQKQMKQILERALAQQQAIRKASEEAHKELQKLREQGLIKKAAL